MSVKDFNGREYEHLDDMLYHYDISPRVYNRRKELGYDLRERLLGVDSAVYDHDGLEFKDVKSLCKHYNVSVDLLRVFLLLGASIYDCLEGERLAEVRDHAGVKYGSLSELCRKYEVTKVSFLRLLEQGHSVEFALTHRVGKGGRLILDHLGNSYKSTSEMLEYYGISSATFSWRRRNGWSLEDCLCGSDKGYFDINVGLMSPETSGTIKSPVVDVESVRVECWKFSVKGHVYSFKDAVEACESFNIPIEVYNRNLILGLPVEESIVRRRVLTKSIVATPTEPIISVTGMCRDHAGREFNSFRHMCNVYGVPEETVKSSLSYGIKLEDALSLVPISKKVRLNDYDSPVKKKLKRKVSYDKGASIDLSLPIKDFCGNTFVNYKSGCDYWGIDKRSYVSYLKLKRETSGDISKAMLKTVVVWVDDRAYDGYKSFCTSVGIDVDLYLSARERGLDHKRAVLSARSLGILRGKK